MLKAIIRTVGFFGTVFAAGYVAQRYFGWDSKALLDQAKDKLNDATAKSPNLKASVKEVTDRHAV